MHQLYADWHVVVLIKTHFICNRHDSVITVSLLYTHHPHPSSICHVIWRTIASLVSWLKDQDSQCRMCHLMSICVSLQGCAAEYRLVWYYWVIWHVTTWSNIWWPEIIWVIFNYCLIHEKLIFVRLNIQHTNLSLYKHIFTTKQISICDRTFFSPVSQSWQ